MLKKTETEETIGFNVTFLALMAFELGGGQSSCPPPLGYAYYWGGQNHDFYCTRKLNAGGLRLQLLELKH